MPRKEYNERGTATQPVLPIFDVPKVVRAHGLRDAHSRPLAAAGKGRGGFRPRRVSTSDAWLHFASIEVRTGNSYPAILLDCDGRDGTAALVEALAAHMLPAPSWTVYRASSGGTHAAWCLAVPVHRVGRCYLGPGGLEFFDEQGTRRIALYADGRRAGQLAFLDEEGAVIEILPR